MASMIDFKQLMKEERERFKQQTKKNATTLTKNDNNNKDAITTQLDLIKEINKKYDSLEIKELKINEKHEHKTIKDFEIKNSEIEDLEKYLTLVDADLKPYLSAGIKNYFITKAAYSELQKESSDINYLGDLMNKHHLLLRDNLKITVPRIDSMIENSLKAGAIGAKIIGSGGGGCIVAISEPGNEEKIISEIKKAGAIDAFLIKETEGAIVYK